ncbi:MAG: T9SS type A sorting domain-containing protein [Bacteroidales bacterium]|nr:T9SS type A sorting domain-containing protein [Bacteroidales bacterium]
MRFFTIIVIGFFSLTSLSQDTIRIMHYNLLMYGDNFGGCTSSNNNVNDKNGYLKTILDYIKPDIVTVNEIYKDSYYHDLILDSVFNIEGVNYYARGNPPNLSNGYTVNQVYYNTQLFTLESNNAISTSIRDIDIFTFSYNTSNSTNDPELNCVVAHLKAGNTQGDATERANETNALMNYLDNNNAMGNYIFSGDFNVYTASEQAFKNLLFHSNEDIRFYDPINKIGEWHSNYFFANEHTQSTHTFGECPSGGGLDDRFDFILISDEIKDGTEDIEYISDSYWAVGQDGLHYNKSLIDSPENTSVPPDVLSALYNMSDHLPVIMDLLVNDDLGFTESPFQNFNLSFNNPVKDYLEITFAYGHPTEISFDLMSINGNAIYSLKTDQNSNTITIPVSHLMKGHYLLKISDGNGNVSYRKVIKL